MTPSTRSTFFAASFVALLAATGLTGCAESLTAPTTASSRREPGSGALAGLGGGRDGNTPAPAESRAFERPARDTDAHSDRDARSFSRNFDCRMCR